MKSLNIILLSLVVIMLSVMIGQAYAAYAITLTDLRVKSFSIYRKDVSDGGDPPVITQEIAMKMYGVLYNSGGDSKGITTQFTLTAGQQTHFLNDIKSFVQSVGTDYDVIIPAWAQ